MTSTSYTGPKASVDLCAEKLVAFSDYVVLRDVKAQSRKPGLMPLATPRGQRLRVRDDFSLCSEYIISPRQGAKFLDITKDPNEIHAKEHITPGAMTVAKILLPLEILAPGLKINSLRTKFTAAAFYGERTVSTMRWRYQDETSVHIDVAAYQMQRPVVTAYLSAEICPEFACIEEIKERKVNQDQLERVVSFLETLGVEPEAYFDKDGQVDFTYPFAFMASLPPGAIVREFRGQGGMINVLSLDLSDKAKMPITGRSGPEVRLEKGRLRQSFRRIITSIADGIVTYYRGAAVVNPIASFQ
ncbi:MAG: hypothetical protein GXP25_23580 [Planctomycetes bacterium]|nr:hypothetical protein [Planctomycetota bacterium]